MSCSRCFGQFCLLVIMHEVCLACCKNLCVTSNQTPIDRHDEFHVFGAIGMWCIIPAAALLFLLVPAGKGDDGARQPCIQVARCCKKTSSAKAPILLLAASLCGTGFSRTSSVVCFSKSSSAALQHCHDTRCGA